MICQLVDVLSITFIMVGVISLAIISLKGLAYLIFIRPAKKELKKLFKEKK